MSSGESTTTLTPDRKEKLLFCIKNGLLNFPIYHISLLNYKVHDPEVTQGPANLPKRALT